MAVMVMTNEPITESYPKQRQPKVLVTSNIFHFMCERGLLSYVIVKFVSWAETNRLNSNIIDYICRFDYCSVLR